MLKTGYALYPACLGNWRGIRLNNAKGNAKQALESDNKEENGLAAKHLDMV
ncbi:hypothetical protein [Pedobacter sp.]|uniref:hypothetical protein n=1 Tax=Pedobacter sp. TaxID=1411316 RepID=UPI0031D22D32